jgi:hypothetical protein
MQWMKYDLDIVSTAAGTQIDPSGEQREKTDSPRIESLEPAGKSRWKGSSPKQDLAIILTDARMQID